MGFKEIEVSLFVECKIILVYNKNGTFSSYHQIVTNWEVIPNTNHSSKKWKHFLKFNGMMIKYPLSSTLLHAVGINYSLLLEIINSKGDVYFSKILYFSLKIS
jgi:hypothetical protein